MTNLVIQNLQFAYQKHQPILNHINLTIQPNSWTLFYGISGSGKSTLLRLLAGLLPKYGGKLLQGSIKLPAGKKVGMMFQDPGLQFALDTPEHEIEFALENLQVPTSEIDQRLTKALQFCNIEQLREQPLTTLSGGEQQRVALAVLVAMDVDILLLDEPFANIDNANREFLINQLQKLQHTHHKTIIIADHDLHGYANLATQIVLFQNQTAMLLDDQARQTLLARADQQANATVSIALPTSAEQPLIKLDHLLIQPGQQPLIKADNFAFFKNRITLLTGATGTGKSSLFKALTKLNYFQGNIFYDQQNIQKISARRYARLVSYVFQRASDQFLNVTVGEELALSLKHGHNPYFDDQHLQAALNLIGLSGFENRIVYSLSGGQKKKLQILLMLMMGPTVLLLDEPLSGLDTKSMQAVIQLIQASQAVYPQTLIIISHQLTGLRDFVDFHVHLQDQQLIYQEEL